MIEWNRKRKLWQLPLLASIISILCLVRIAVDIIMNQMLSLGDIIVVATTILCSSALVGVSVWQAKRQQVNIPKSKKQQGIQIPKQKVGAFITAALGFFLLVSGICLGILLENSSPYAAVFVGIGIVVFVYGIATLNR
jgi:hypothetical protein